jgi:hypothetical protein
MGKKSKSALSGARVFSDPANWSPEEKQHVAKRYTDSLMKATVDESSPHKCLIAQNRRADGYAQTKVFGMNPRTYTLAPFVTGNWPQQGQDFSHRCGNGAGGCIHPDHLHMESRKANLGRQSCHMMTKCPNCNVQHPVAVCKCEPPCLQTPTQ